MDEANKQILVKIADLMDRHPDRVIPVLAKEFGLEPPEATLINQLNLNHSELGRVRLRLGTELAGQGDKPFDWQAEITYPDVKDVWRHYLLLVDGRLVRAERSKFHEVSESETQTILSELEQLK